MTAIDVLVVWSSFGTSCNWIFHEFLGKRVSYLPQRHNTTLEYLFLFIRVVISGHYEPLNIYSGEHQNLWGGLWSAAWFLKNKYMLYDSLGKLYKNGSFQHSYTRSWQKDTRLSFCIHYKFYTNTTTSWWILISCHRQFVTVILYVFQFIKPIGCQSTMSGPLNR